MIELSRHIEILLLDNDCVIVPGFGGFMAHAIPAEYVEDESMFYPPQRTIGFNPQLQLNDSLLAQAYVEAYDISYPEAVRRLASEVEEIKQLLAIEGEYEFHGIGTVRQTNDNRYEFYPDTAGLLTPSLYALTSLYINKVNKVNLIDVPVTGFVDEKDKDTVAVLDSTSVDIDDTAEIRSITISMEAVRNILVAALVLILFVFSSTPAGKGISSVQQCSVLDTEIIKAFTHGKMHSDSTFVQTVMQKDTTNVTVKTSDDNQKDKQQSYFSIVLASKVSREGAELFVSQMKNRGYKNVTIYEKGNMRKVLYGQYATETEAANALSNLRESSDSFKESWISKI